MKKKMSKRMPKRVLALMLAALLAMSNMVAFADDADAATYVSTDENQDMVEKPELEESQDTDDNQAIDANQNTDENNKTTQENKETVIDDDSTPLASELLAIEEYAEEADVEEEISRDDSKIDVWDFSAAELDDDTYNNLLTVNKINGLYSSSMETGSQNKENAFGSSDLGYGLELHDGNQGNVFRIRTSNTDITRYDNKTYKAEDGDTYQGALYVNKSGNKKTNMTITADQGDIITVVVSSNGADSTIHFVSSDEKQDNTDTYQGNANMKIMRFLAETDDTYTIYSENEKLVVARIYREHGEEATVKGTVTAPKELTSEYQLVFTNRSTEKKTVVKVENGNFSTQLCKGFHYNVTLKNATGYDILGSTVLDLTDVGNTEEMNIEIGIKTLYDVTITPQGATLEDLKNAVFTFSNVDDENASYEFTGTEQIALCDGTYEVKVSNAGRFVQKKTSNLVVNGSAVTKTISFDGNVTEWSFDAKDFCEGTYTNNSGEYNGLKFTNAKSHNNTYMLAGADTVISVPVSGDCKISVYSCYEYEFQFKGDESTRIAGASKSTVQIDENSYVYTGTAGYVEIQVLGQSYLNKITISENTAYQSTITVGETGCDYTTIGAALEAVRKMDRSAEEEVTIEIEPGDYEEMLVLDMDHVTLRNASSHPTTELINKGVSIDENSVRITSYYGHGYNYYSMNDDGKWDEETLTVNKENGSASYTNPGAGTTNGSYWNATVVISGSDIQAENIIFENSFNQYVSKKASEDIIVKTSSAKEGSTPRAELSEGSTEVQNKKYVERAAALAMTADAEQIGFNNCKFIGRQDTLYGAIGNEAAFYQCEIFGGTDFIFGGMTAVFAECDLVMNTMSDKNDVAYITAPQQKNTRGYLFYNCHITSAVPGVETASEEVSKPGYLGRPWQVDTSEVIYYHTTIDVANDGTSLIKPEGWSNSLSGKSEHCYEFLTEEKSGVDNSNNRVDWAVGADEALSKGIEIAFSDFCGDNISLLKSFGVDIPEGTLPIKEETLITPDVPVVTPGTPENGQTTSENIQSGSSSDSHEHSSSSGRRASGRTGINWILNAADEQQNVATVPGTTILEEVLPASGIAAGTDDGNTAAGKKTSTAGSKASASTSQNQTTLITDEETALSSSAEVSAQANGTETNGDANLNENTNTVNSQKEMMTTNQENAQSQSMMIHAATKWIVFAIALCAAILGAATVIFKKKKA